MKNDGKGLKDVCLVINKNGVLLGFLRGLKNRSKNIRYLFLII